MIFREGRGACRGGLDVVGGATASSRASRGGEIVMLAVVWH